MERNKSNLDRGSLSDRHMHAFDFLPYSFLHVQMFCNEHVILLKSEEKAVTSIKFCIKEVTCWQVQINILSNLIKQMLFQQHSYNKKISKDQADLAHQFHFSKFILQRYLHMCTKIQDLIHCKIVCNKLSAINWKQLKCPTVWD